ncbi:MAG: type II toxin-antitoxin system RelE/ParE family toxin [Breznakibacter sp.]
MLYNVKIEPQALADIQEISDWYNNKLVGLGKRFQNAVIKQIDDLRKNPYVCAIRYYEIRCKLINRFPYMVHFYINEKSKTVEVLAVISTSRYPKVWTEMIE